MATTIDQLALMTDTVVDGDLLVLRDVSVTGNNKDVKLTIGKLKSDVIGATSVLLTGDQTVGGNKTLTGTTIFNGNVGIGTTVASARHHVVGSNTALPVSIVQGTISQAAPLQEWRNGVSGVVGQITSNGGIRSGEVTIADDAAHTLYTDSFVGMLLITTTVAPQAAGLVNVRGGASNPHAVLLAGGTDIAVTTSDVTGTSGTDGKMTVSATATAIKVENRLGAARTIRWLQIR